jgi:hypothetical protein
MPKSNLENELSSQILIYQSDDGKIKLDVELRQETVWLNQEQMAVLFGKAKSTINEHIQNMMWLPFFGQFLTKKWHNMIVLG